MANDQIRELAVTNALTDAYLLLQEVKDIKRNLSMELDLARDRRLAQEKDFRAFMSELWETLRKIQAQFRVEAELMNLIKPEKVGESECHNKNSNRSNLLNEFAKPTS